MYVDCCLLYEHHVCIAFVVSMWLFNFDMMMNMDDEYEDAAKTLLLFKPALSRNSICFCLFCCWLMMMLLSYYGNID